MNRTRIVLLVCALIVLIPLAYLASNPEAGQSVLVDLGLAEPAADQYLASGMLEAQTYTLSTEYGGRVAELPAAQGQAVSAGQTIAKIESDLLELQIQIAEAQLDEAQAQYAMVVADPREVDLAVAQAAVALAEATLQSAQQAMQDAEDTTPASLWEKQADAAQAQVDQAQANLDAAQAALTALQDGASQATIDGAMAGLEAANAALESLNAQLEGLEIDAPIDGVVLEHLLQPGELALPGWPVLRMADLSELELVVYLPESDLNWVAVGQTVKVQADAYPDRDFEGQVTHIADQAEFTPRNVQTPDERTILVYAVTIKIPNPDGALKPGLPAEAVFEVQS